MTRHLVYAGVVQVAALWLFVAGSSAGSDQTSPPRRGRAEFNLLRLTNQEAAPRLVLRPPVGHLRHRFYQEADGAITQAEDWLRTNGLSLLEERDSEGHHSYQILSGSLASEGPAVLLHTRLGRPRLSAGLRPSRQVPALGLTIPGESYTFEVEGLRDRDYGWTLMGTARWSDPQERVQYGVAIPLSVRGTPSVGALVQVRIRFGE